MSEPARRVLGPGTEPDPRFSLANERTYLAWWRTGIAGVAAGFAVGRVVPEVVEGRSWPYVAVGAARISKGPLLEALGDAIARGATAEPL